mmetsp:Transcript_43584/g.124931  ORF Transcript_43584/g.124931 Transcript_43584/m.124931 type:complete len:279 (-) Transcript_43584:820-1656(-)
MGVSRHGFPSLVANELMNRTLSWEPWQLLLQRDQSPQSASAQSSPPTSASSHSGTSRQTSKSSAGPVTLCPQDVGCVFTSRERVLNAVPHVLEHSPHSPHESQSPSMQPLRHSTCVLQGSTSFLSFGGQKGPLSGLTSTTRLLCLMPPPQDAEQVDQANHSPHKQSLLVQSCSLHSPSSSRGPSQPRPPLLALASTRRLRVCSPAPHRAEQVDQSSQSLSLQLSSSVRQGTSLQAISWERSAFLHSPPSVLGESNLRSRRVWPPSHVLSHLVQSVHSE